MYDFTNIHEGKPGFVIGGGTSLDYLIENPDLLEQLNNYVTVGTNKSYILLEPDYLVIIDDYLWDDFNHELLGLENTQIFAPEYSTCGHNARAEEASNIHIFNGLLGRYNLPESMLDPISTKNNAGVTALRIAYVLGLNPIYLLGIDLRDEDLERFNFHNEYDKERQDKISLSKIQVFKKAFHQTIEAIHRKGVQVYNCSHLSTLNVTYKPITEILGGMTV